MKKKSLDLSKRLDPLTLDIFQSLAEIAARLNISFFIVGATARDVILTNIYGIPTVRATADIDLFSFPRGAKECLHGRGASRKKNWFLPRCSTQSVGACIPLPRVGTVK
ncbi:MAG: hypothetical protein ABFS56_10305 [Pseudomonadota bacterium]